MTRAEVNTVISPMGGVPQLIVKVLLRHPILRKLFVISCSTAKVYEFAYCNPRITCLSCAGCGSLRLLTPKLLWYACANNSRVS